MNKSFLLVCALLVSPAVYADRFTQMNQNELCTYTAQLQVAAYYYFEQGKPREDVKIKWHGDETQNEIGFVNRIVADAYTRLAGFKGGNGKFPTAQSFGDMVYQACMSETES
jgi:hypothetical protein